MAFGPARRAELDRLIAFPFAHRGLHGASRIENSRAAFNAAIDAGHGIELDVQTSRDGTAFVFHDHDLERLTEAKGALADRAAIELQAIRLRGTEETVPPLVDILRLIGGQTPLLIELKAPDRNVARLCMGVFRSLEAYRGSVAIMSFNPEVGHWFARHAPRILRGLVVTENGKGEARSWVERRMALWRAKPDFLAYDIRDLPSPFATAQRRRGLPILTWTVRSDEEQARAALHTDQIIYEAQTAA